MSLYEPFREITVIKDAGSNNTEEFIGKFGSICFDQYLSRLSTWIHRNLSFDSITNLTSEFD